MKRNKQCFVHVRWPLASDLVDEVINKKVMKKDICLQLFIIQSVLATEDCTHTGHLLRHVVSNAMTRYQATRMWVGDCLYPAHAPPPHAPTPSPPPDKQPCL